MFQSRPFISHLWALALLLIFLSPQALAQAPAKANALPTLADALTRAAPPDDGIALAVGADKVTLPKGSAPPDIQSPVPDVADAYGRVVQEFGIVAAVAPPTMAVVGVPPNQVNPYDGMPPADVLKLLAGSMDRDQWKLLLGASGLGLPDLTTQTQRDLFAALFPNGVFKVQWDRPGEPNRPEDIRDVSAELPSARLRLGQRVNLGLPKASDRDTHTYGMSFAPAGSPKQYIQVVPEGNKDDFVDGARVRAVLPNALKDGQLDLDTPALKVPVPLVGLKTLGDLFLRVGRLTHLELYADARFEGRRLSVVGTAGGKALSAPASDLLRASAFCLTGTYRKVGPAFVLTDDVVGIGARRQEWADFEREAAAGRQKALDAAGDAVYAGHSALDVPAQGNLMGLSVEQFAAVRKQRALDRAHGDLKWGDILRLSLPFAKLTPGQQEVAQHTADYYSREPEEDRPTLEGMIDLEAWTSLQVLLPSVDGVVSLDDNLDSLFSPSMATMARLNDQTGSRPGLPRMAWEEQTGKAAALPLAPLLKNGTRRAVLAHPTDAAGVDALVASMKVLGLNQLWLPIFSGGVSHTDILAEALKVTPGTGIQVFAVLDLLTWSRDAAKKAGKKAGEGAEDLTLRGETSDEAADRETRLRLLRSGQESSLMRAQSADAPLAVSPFAAPVRETLRAVLADLAARPGLAGVVWRDTAPAGYLPQPRRTGGSAEPLGYTEPARLLFLRACHADPVDLFPGDHQGEQADTRLPEFDSPSLESALCAGWDKFREESVLAFLLSLATETTGRVILASRGPDYGPGANGPGWYGTWDDPAHPPTYREVYRPSERVQARAQSRVSIHPIQTWFLGVVPKTEANRVQMLTAFKQSLRDRLPTDPARAWDGFVLDTIPPSLYHLPARPPFDPLAPLVADLLKP